MTTNAPVVELVEAVEFVILVIPATFKIPNKFVELSTVNAPPPGKEAFPTVRLPPKFIFPATPNPA